MTITAKKAIFAIAAVSLMSIGTAANATDICSGGSATKATVNPAATSQFIKTSFTTPCSTNVNMSYSESEYAAWAAAASKKGACYQIGHTDAGVRTKTTGCSPASADFTTDPTTTGTAGALTAAQAIGSSS